MRLAAYGKEAGVSELMGWLVLAREACGLDGAGHG